jgi:hypothetical protein
MKNRLLVTPPHTHKQTRKIDIRKLRISIKISSVFFGLNLALYLFNPYYLLRPLQIVVNKDTEPSISNYFSNKFDVVNNEIYNLIAIPSKPGLNWSTTRKTRIDLFLKGIGNCSQKSSGMGLVLNSQHYNYSIVHFLPKKGLFKGYGHTILNVIRDSSSFLVDPTYNVLLIIDDKMFNKRLMNKQDLYNRFKIYGMNSKKSIFEIESEFWEPNYTSAYAEVSQSSMNNYFNFTNFLSSLFGSDDANWKRIIINGVAAICWQLPTFQVKQSDYISLTYSYPEFVFLKYLAYIFVFNIYFLASGALIYVTMKLL